LTQIVQKNRKNDRNHFMPILKVLKCSKILREFKYLSLKLFMIRICFINSSFQAKLTTQETFLNIILKRTKLLSVLQNILSFEPSLLDILNCLARHYA